MGLKAGRRSRESRFTGYVEALSSALGHADRAAPFHSYCAGLLLPGDRKSVEPMAARLQPGRVQAAHQSLHHFVAKSDWSDDTVLAAVRARVLPLIAKRGPIRALIIDDTGMPKKGRHSVGVARQYCGQLGKQDNCQVAVSLTSRHFRNRRSRRHGRGENLRLLLRRPIPPQLAAGDKPTRRYSAS